MSSRDLPGLVIIGGSAAGVAAALEARRLDPELPITLVSGEHVTPYARPSLMYLFMGRLRLHDLALRPPESWEAMRVTRRWGWATSASAHPEGGGVVTIKTPAGDEELPFSSLLITTGASPRRLSCEGAALRGVCDLWGLPELARLASLTPQARKALVVGGGLIGAELSEMLLSRGVEVTQLVREERYAPHLLNRHESELVAQELREIGVHLALEHELIAARGASGQVTGAEVRGPEGKRRLACELIAVAIGSRPELGLAQTLGLSLDPVGGGLAVDARFKTSVADVYAAGDCAAALSASGARWPKGWVSAERQGRLAARAILKRPAEERPLDQDPQLIPLISRFGRLTHSRVGAPPSDQADEGLTRLWRHPRRPALLSLYTHEGGLSAVSALGRPLHSAQWLPLIAEASPVSSLDERLLSEATRGLTRVL